MIPVYRAGRQLIKVRAVMVLSLVVLPLCLWWGLDLAQTHVLNEAASAALASVHARAACGGLGVLLGIAFAAEMWVYGGHYAARVEYDPGRMHIHLHTVGFFWANRHVIRRADLGPGRERAGSNRV